MIKRIPTNNGDETYSTCVVAGDFVFLAHHAGGFDKNDVKHQMRTIFENIKKTLKSVDATLNDMVQINLYLKNLDDFSDAREVFNEYFDKGNFPARMTSQTEFLDGECLCMIDGVVYKPNC